MLYLKYEQFVELGGGEEVTENEFCRIAYRVQKIIDRETHMRIQSMNEVPEEVRRAMLELIMLDARNAAVLNGEGAVKSFSTDGYSETREAVTKDTLNAMRWEVLNDFLSDVTDDNGVPLLYMGVDA